MAIEHHRHHRPKRRSFDPEFVAIIRILVVTGVLAVLLGLLNHYG